MGVKSLHSKRIWYMDKGQSHDIHSGWNSLFSKYERVNCECLSSVVIDQYLTELWFLDLAFSWKFEFSGHFLDYFLHIDWLIDWLFTVFRPLILKWNLLWLFAIMSCRSSLIFVVIDQFFIELWTLELGIFMKISVFWTFLD
jgi:hypothetical protein